MTDLESRGAFFRLSDQGPRGAPRLAKDHALTRPDLSQNGEAPLRAFRVRLWRDRPSKRPFDVGAQHATPPVERSSASYFGPFLCMGRTRNHRLKTKPALLTPFRRGLREEFRYNSMAGV